MANPMESLQTLLRMKTPQQVQTGDPWLARRQGEIASGLDEFLPDADSPDYKYDQMEKGAKYGVSLPRADARSGHLAQLKQMLGIGEVEQRRALEQEALKGQFGVEANRAGADAQMQRLLATQGNINQRSEADREARSAALEQRLGSVESNQAARDAAAMERAQFTQGSLDARAEAKRPKGLWEMIFGSSKTATAPAAPPASAPAEAAGSMNAAEYDYDPATGRVVPRR